MHLSGWEIGGARLTLQSVYDKHHDRRNIPIAGANFKLTFTSLCPTLRASNNRA